jgi:capsular polysaccharide export protein
MTLAMGLKEAGHSPTILLYSKAKGRYFENNGIQTISLDANEPKNILDKGVTIDSFLEAGIKYSDVMTAEARRRPIVGWPGQRAKTIRDIHRIHKTIANIIETTKPEKIIIWNGFTGWVANILRFVCEQRKIECAFLERGLLKGSLFIDRMGVNGASSLNGLSPSIVDNFSLSDEDTSFIKQLFNIDPQTSENVTPKKRLNIFFPLQVQLDTNIILYCKYRTMRETFLDIYSNLNSQGSSFLIRPHPEETSDALINIPRFDNVKVSSEKNLDHWLDWSDLVVTINSTVGLEALIKGKQVISLGQSIYSSAGLTNDLNEKDLSKGVNYQRLIKYLGWLLKSNLLLPNGPYNDSVLSAQLGITSEIIAPAENEKGSKAAEPQVDIATVHLAFPLNSTLDLTYRKNKTPITKDWLTEITKKHIDAKQYEFSTSRKPNKDRYSIKIVNECKSAKPDYKFSKTIDIYGNEVR